MSATNGNRLREPPADIETAIVLARDVNARLRIDIDGEGCRVRVYDEAGVIWGGATFPKLGDRAARFVANKAAAILCARMRGRVRR